MLTANDGTQIRGDVFFAVTPLRDVFQQDAVASAHAACSQ